MEKVTWKPGTMLSPVPPAMISCGSMENPNIITIAWTGIINTNPAMTYISVRPSRYSYAIIKKSGEFVINLTTQKLAFSADYCGVVSGAKVNKFECMKLTPQKASILEAPMIAESPLNIECRVNDIVPLGTHHMFTAEIVAVNVSKKHINANGKLDLERCGLVAYSHGEYFALGQKLGEFGFSVKKKKKQKKNKGLKP